MSRPQRSEAPAQLIGALAQLIGALARLREKDLRRFSLSLSLSLSLSPQRLLEGLAKLLSGLCIAQLPRTAVHREGPADPGHGPRAGDTELSSSLQLPAGGAWRQHRMAVLSAADGGPGRDAEAGLAVKALT